MSYQTTTVRRRVIAVCRIVTLATGIAANLQAANSPQFRGADSRGVAPDNPRLPEQWSQGENVVWKIPVPGRGWSSPIVWDDKVFVTTVVSEGKVEEPKPGLYFGGERPTP